MRARFVLPVAAACVLGVAAGAVPPVAGAAGPDAAATVWLCRPGLDPNPCEASRTTTVVRADGSERVRPAKDVPAPPIDCFYVYPTVSSQPTANADLSIDPELTAVARVQASRFSEACRVFAPVYPQITRAAIRDGRVADRRVTATAYLGMRAAWQEYLANDNDGRGVVLLGHSQGAALLTALVRNEIEGDAALRRRIVAALLIGTGVTVPVGEDVGGSFMQVPACRKRDQTGCVVAYSTFGEPPPADAMFGRVGVGLSAQPGTADAGLEVLCVNPAAPDGGSAELDAYFPTTSVPGSAADVPSRFEVSTPWVRVPGLYAARCEQADGASWLQVDDVGGPGDERPRVTAALGPRWGLHLVDVNLALGDLVAMVRRQSRTYTRTEE